MANGEFTPKWQGYVVTGIVDRAKLQSDIDACFAGGEMAGLIVEPARIFSAAGGVRKRVEVWNANRTKVKVDSECKSPDVGNTEAYVRNYVGTPDVLRVAGGYQVGLRHNGDSTIIVRANPSGGELGAPTEEIPLFPGESSVIGASFMDGGINCDNVLRSINGVSGPTLHIYSDSGVTIGNHTALNRIVIAVKGEGLNFCPDVSPAEQVPCPPSTGVNCGPAAGVATACPGAPDSKAGFLSTTATGGGSTPPATTTPTSNAGDTVSYQRLYGTCQFERTQAGWVQKVNNAAFNAHCVSPTSSGYIGQVRTLTAAPDSVPIPGYVRNPLFNNGSTYWQLPAVATITSAEASTLFGRLPYIEFTGTLKQPLITIPAGRYRLQMQYSLTAIMSYKIHSPRDGITLLESDVDPQLEFRLLTEFFDTPADDITIEFTSSAGAKITDIALIPWQVV
jgi:hypothetical protein